MDGISLIPDVNRPVRLLLQFLEMIEGIQDPKVKK